MDKKEFEKKVKKASLNGEASIFLELKGGDGVLVVSSSSVSKNGDVFLFNESSMGHIPLKSIKGVF